MRIGDLLLMVMLLIIQFQLVQLIHVIAFPQKITCTETVRVGISTYCSEYKVGRE